jgi:hypothetical protein
MGRARERGIGLRVYTSRVKFSHLALVALIALISAGAGYLAATLIQSDEPRNASVPDASPALTATVTATQPSSSSAPTVVATEPVLSPTATAAATLPAPSPTAAAVPGFDIRMVALREETPEYSIDIEYPQTGFASDERVRYIAETAARELRDYAEQFPPGELSPGPYSLTSSIPSIYVSPEFVSIRFVLHSYTGGAHGGSVIHGFNNHRDDGAEVSLEDALSLVGLSLEAVANGVNEELTTRLGSSFFEDGALPVPENYETFVIDGDNVTFIFQEYQVGPYAVGPQEVAFPRVATP